MQDENGFLEAIAANPEDDSIRLVYADWLEERGDPRAEYLRLEVQYRELIEQLACVKKQLQELPGQIQTSAYEFDASWIDRVTPLRRLVLQSYPSVQKIAVIKLIREATGCGLREAKELSEACPRRSRAGSRKAKAKGIRKRFEPYATLTIEPDPGRRPIDPSLTRVILHSYLPERKIAVIKLIREVTGLGLQEAKDLAEAHPGDDTGAAPGFAEQIRQQFAELATVSVEKA